ncbi:diphosphomevalonate decarboxylase [Pleurotus pulmonarius]|nr:diphosphomevalonate decarboxylase [Pleurotus pulmonarius]
MVYQATASAPVNIACIKYWGKRDTKLILPTNSSLSVTLSQDHLRSTTTSRADPSFSKDRLWLNGKEEEIVAPGRLATCIAELKKMRKELVEDKDASAPKLSTFPVHIASFNNFPTAAGLASSASGFAALVSSLAALYALPCSPSTLSLIARQGSGSACRSLFGGYVAWEQGVLDDGSDSLAVEVAPRSHWPEMHALICVVSDDKKGTSSTSGMQRTVQTSELLQHRIKHVVPKRMKEIEAAIKAKDFDAFAKVTMADSNQSIIALIVEYNRVAIEKTGKRKAAYTYDAGPNAVIYTLQENVKEIVELIVKYFPQKDGFKDPFQLFAGEGGVGEGRVVEGFNEAVAKKFEVGAVKGLIHTNVGDGPRVLDAEEALLGPDGLPKSLA